MNRINLTGRWTKDPELRHTPQGTPVASCSIAVHEGYGDNRKTHFFDVVMWKKTAENVCNFSKKGDRVGVDGRLTSRSYEANDGRKVKVVEIVANEVEFLETKKESGGYQSQERPNQGGSYNNQGNRNPNPGNHYPSYGDDSYPPLGDDDLPF